MLSVETSGAINGRESAWTETSDLEAVYWTSLYLRREPRDRACIQQLAYQEYAFKKYLIKSMLDTNAGLDLDSSVIEEEVP